MKIVRSWPAVVPDDRCYVVDTLPRFVMDDYDYRGLGDLDDDILLVEWDIAVSQDDLSRMLGHIEATPDRVLVAPYMIYMATRRDQILRRPLWSCRRYDPDGRLRHVQEGEPSCHLFGMGLTYLPRELVGRFLDDWPGQFNDGAFSGWHKENVGEASICWDVRPVHLHYPIDRM